LSEITSILQAIDAGDVESSKRLLPLVYEELRRLAAARMAQEASGHTLEPTALVHEAYVRLVGQFDRRRWDGRGHFFAAAAEAMRRILVENARRKKRLRHGGGWRRIDGAEAEEAAAPAPNEDVVELDEALCRLAVEDPVAARIVELRHFAGLGHKQIAATLGLTVYQTRQKWTYARAWLRDALGHV
jgi:RNA polymerase sigma factor (TIGR02999 family)